MLATTRELATFHADRALFYRVIAELVGTPPTAKSLRTLAAAVTGTTERGAARAALEAAIVTADPAAIVAEYERLVRDPAAPITTRCAGDAELYRHEAFTSSGRAEDERPASEALVLAALAERAARAIRRTDLAEASALLALQHRFL
ncbi:hypothetical protein L6R52_01490, partial [Myxococcota bacterium]|nr:hypothetical protein [Myxococcota bacterium]